MSDPGELAGRVALVTGASRGIGRAIAVALGEAKVAVGLVARSAGDLEETAALVSSVGGTACCAPADVGDAAATLSALATIGNALGPVDILVNNAGVLWPAGPLVKLDPETWIEATVINLFGPVRLTTALLPSMLERGYGRILNVSTGAVARAGGSSGLNAYVASKSALEAHSICLAAELDGTGVTVNVLRPGTVDTAMQTWIRSQPPEQVGLALRDRFLAMYENGQLISAEIPARLAVETISSDRNGEIVAPPRPS